MLKISPKTPLILLQGFLLSWSFNSYASQFSQFKKSNSYSKPTYTPPIPKSGTLKSKLEELTRAAASTQLVLGKTINTESQIKKVHDDLRDEEAQGQILELFSDAEYDANFVETLKEKCQRYEHGSTAELVKEMSSYIVLSSKGSIDFIQKLKLLTSLNDFFINKDGNVPLSPSQDFFAKFMTEMAVKVDERNVEYFYTLAKAKEDWLEPEANLPFASTKLGLFELLKIKAKVKKSLDDDANSSQDQFEEETEEEENVKLVNVAYSMLKIYSQLFNDVMKRILRTGSCRSTPASSFSG